MPVIGRRAPSFLSQETLAPVSVPVTVKPWHQLPRLLAVGKKSFKHASVKWFSWRRLILLVGQRAKATVVNTIFGYPLPQAKSKAVILKALCDT
ncbi:hypothetical protein EYF80_003774 [Liparis tanakae]|uniref:Uncharacterized protein n=1 Tax=Liparis tanakae TaxID=230148 RepID=A0A4Z2J716_9TELE|nr:hypothetical protein EYF80_003774 [Liparis tanakae]